MDFRLHQENYFQFWTTLKMEMTRRKRKKDFIVKSIYIVLSHTGCARDLDLYKLVSCGKFVNETLFCIIYKTLYHTLG